MSVPVLHATTPRIPTPVESAHAGVTAEKVSKSPLARPLIPEKVTRKDLVKDYPTTYATKVDWYQDGHEFFPKIFEEIENERESIHIGHFGFGAVLDQKKFFPGEPEVPRTYVAQRMAKLLARKAREGVDVRVTVDRFGSRVDADAKELFDLMERSGVKLVTQDGLLPFKREGVVQNRKLFKRLGNPKRGVNSDFSHSDHRKLYIFGGKRAYIGGMGVEDHFENRFHDSMMGIEGEPVRQLQESFLRQFVFQGGKLKPEEQAKLFPKLKRGDIQMKLFAQVPGEGHRPITEDLYNEVRAAKKTLDIVSPFWGDPKLNRLLCQAANRGVKIRMLMPGMPEYGYFARSHRYSYHKLQRAGRHGGGIEIYEYPTLLHAKAVIRDGKEVSYGSSNLDGLSLVLNYETNLRISSRRVAQTILQRFLEPDFQKLEPLPLMPRRTLKEYLEGWAALRVTSFKLW